jgi:hypothetical protein
MAIPNLFARRPGWAIHGDPVLDFVREEEVFPLDHHAHEGKRWNLAGVGVLHQIEGLVLQSRPPGLGASLKPVSTGCSISHEK